MDIFGPKKIRPMPYLTGIGAFHSPDYLFDLDPAGAHCIAYLDADGTALRSERNVNILPLFPELQALHTAVGARCIVDGQIIVPSDNAPDERALLNRISACIPPMVRAQSEAHPALFIALDLLYLQDKPLLARPLSERRRLLRETIADGPRIEVSLAVDSAGAALYELSRQQDLPGMLARRKDGLYTPGRSSRACLRIGGRASELFIACGAIEREGGASLLLGRFEGTKLAYRGRLSPGVTKEAALRYPTTARCPIRPTPEGAEGAKWYDPLRICLVRRLSEDGGWSLEAFL